jgi:type II secretory pathway pseudopilin PulG
MRKKFELTAQETSGMSLIEIMVVIGLTSMAAMGILSLQNMDLKRMASSRQFSSRDSIKALADRYILDSKIITQSATSSIYQNIASNHSGNEALDYCLNGPPSAPTTLCPASSFPNCCQMVTGQPFVLLDPADASHATIFSGTDSAASPLAPTSSAPARYDINGARCATANSNCALELVTTFNSTCPGGTPSCSKADQIFISYSLRQAPGISPTGGTPLKPLGPTTPVLIASAATSSGGGGGVGIIRVTRNSTSPSASPTVTTLDNMCTAEFGPNYRAASQQEIKVTTGTNLGFEGWFLVYDVGSLATFCSSCTSPNRGMPVACVVKN